MPRKGRATKPELASRLVAVKVMIRDLKDALPTMAKELRRNAVETLDEVIAELTH